MQSRIELVKRSPAEEILTEERLKSYIENGEKLKHYIGFEISGLVHVGTGLLCMSKVADFQEAGIETNIFLADYHSWINKKLGGDLTEIKKIAGGYFKEALKKSIECVGGDPSKVNFVLGSELYKKLGIDYFETVLKISDKVTLSRAKRSVTIAGRKEGESLSLAQYIYPAMQVADIYAQGVNIAHAGMDQRKAHVIAIEVSKHFDYVPVAVHHHLLMGISMTEEQRKRLLEAKKSGSKEEIQEELIDIKMSKSRPDSAIFIHDTEEEIKKKIEKSFCPIKETEFNPVIDLLNYIIWPVLNKRGERLEIERKDGKTAYFSSAEEFNDSYVKGEVHPMDLKKSVADMLTEILEPARKYFNEGNGRKYLEDLKSITITR
ncbi:MAG: tyrosine--tRNA ligase [Candidatus Micrarchaeaceae archaeon]